MCKTPDVQNANPPCRSVAREGKLARFSGFSFAVRSIMVRWLHGESCMTAPTFLMVDPAHFEVSYAINPWMSPLMWQADRAGLHAAARVASAQLAGALRAAGARVETMAGAPGAPDLVFPANAAVVLDRRAILARFLHPERQVEEPVFARAFAGLSDRGLLDEVATLPQGAVHEGAGDAIWDARRALFWAGHGQRSNRRGLDAVAAFFGRDAVPLELATAKFYHLDTCFCALPGGEVLYYPPAFTAEARRAIADRVAPSERIEASDEDAGRFCVNAVALGRTVVMAKAADRLRRTLAERGYDVVDVDLAPFILSGGGAYCMTLRLDRAGADLDAALMEAAQ